MKKILLSLLSALFIFEANAAEQFIQFQKSADNQFVRSVFFAISQTSKQI